MVKVTDRVAIVADQPVVRRGLESILTGSDLTIVGSVAAVTELSGLGPLDLVVLGPCGGPAAVPETVITLRADSKVLVVCGADTPSDAMNAIQAGANGYLTGLAEDRVIRSAAHTVLGGGFAVSADLVGVLQSQAWPRLTMVGARPRGDRPALSPREHETLRWIASGLTHAQTATRMRVSKPTVDTYVARARVKLSLGNKADLTRVVLELDGGALAVAE